MKRIFAVILVLSMLFCFASCDAQKTGNETETTLFESDSEAYEAMTNAAKDGNYDDAIKYYNNGAAGADDADVINWYFYSMAMKEYEDYNCIGYPLDLLQNKVSEDFEPAKAAIGQLQTKVRELNGVYENTGVYLYIADGKLAISAGSQLSGTVFCNNEIVYKDEVCYFAERGQDGTHKLLYTIESVNGGIYLKATENAQDDLYSGTYFMIHSEFPTMVY